ncbi:PREDICTED: complex I intermediate-associated protein 30, mitochondrial [Dufourea novaeangliae]|uniref:Putative complex I intermediate-associated protein 30, mitochondrial n=1 Tax=Dufourea novaeangliae TaxID=178035 RepID=A0A154P3F2_DUFNO|nr:PREDICTED: complex I intermediate-associated protein 30, mitochondrial [Dufourea novaeangliae]KZC06352.1 putative complex I intermediate-associated protein 30, mitochondrial [Dufourea novaeangliae]
MIVRALQSSLRLHGKRGFHKSTSLLYFYEPEKSNYPIIYDNLQKSQKLSLLGKFWEACRNVKYEFSLLHQEIRDYFADNTAIIVPDAEDIIWKFDGTEKCRDQWIVTCDSDYNEGYSKAKLDFTAYGTGLFHGSLSPRVPKDGVIGKAGYCNVTSTRKRKSFYRKSFYDWSCYNTLVLRIRGDGRCYMLNVLQRGHYDMGWYHSFHYFIYTTGSPYWQHVKIPFSKFVFGTKGVIQNDQRPMPLDWITGFGITLGDKKEGPFKLEIDYIALCYDPTVFEECAYELYDVRKL